MHDEKGLAKKVSRKSVAETKPIQKTNVGDYVEVSSYHQLPVKI